MLGKINASANLAVRNIASARKLHQHTRGLTPVGSQGDELIVFRSGDTLLSLYRSQYAGTNQATAVATASTRSSPTKARCNVVHDMRVAWFKDPDGNILNIFVARNWDRDAPVRINREY